VPTTVTVNSVTTADAAPTTAPNKISAQSSKDTATVVFTPSEAGDGHLYPSDALYPRDDLFPDQAPPTIDAWVMRIGGSSASTGTLLEHAGHKCGTFKCGQVKCDSVIAAPLASTISKAVKYADFAGPPADQDETVTIYVNRNGDGWQ
jgi:hypothetical protein